MRSSHLHVVLGAIALTPGCVGTFDPALFMRDAGVDAAVVEADAAGMDAFVERDAPREDTGEPDGSSLDAPVDVFTPSDSALDGGPPLFPLADYCSDPPELVLSGASRTIAINTGSLTDDGSGDIAVCLGRAPTGPDAFFRITAAANERWHFHYRHIGDVDPALYILGTCDLRVCMDNQVVDLCDTGADEHLTFQPTTAGSYIVGVDAYGAEGLTGSLEVYRPTCGNGMREHSETCDDGDRDPGDGCDEQCRDEITSTLTDRGELEVNDDFFSANHVLYTAGTPMLVTGRIATACESDWYVVDLPSASSLSAQMRTMSDTACMGSLDVPDPFTLELVAADGLTRIATGRLDAGGCPGIDPARETVAATLPAGRYFLRVFGAVDTGRRFDYGLSLTITPM
jgi:cysteine-rich repeat protein